MESGPVATLGQSQGIYNPQNLQKPPLSKNSSLTELFFRYLWLFIPLTTSSKGNGHIGKVWKSADPPPIILPVFGPKQLPYAHAPVLLHTL